MIHTFGIYRLRIYEYLEEEFLLYDFWKIIWKSLFLVFKNYEKYYLHFYFWNLKIYGEYYLKCLFVTLGIMEELLFKTPIFGFGNYGELLFENSYFEI
jgi:hypothetical protein